MLISFKKSKHFWAFDSIALKVLTKMMRINGIYFLGTLKRKHLFLILVLLLALSGCKEREAVSPQIQIHYLGHSSFLLQFDNGVSLLTDYGKFNAWTPLWNSPINSIGSFIPTIATYSHFHEDHYAPERIPKGVEYILSRMDSLAIKGLKIIPIRVCEKDKNIEDNSAFFISYQNIRLLHFGDAQAQIMQINNPDVQAHFKSILPNSIDLLFMPIDGPKQFTEQAVQFVKMLKPKKIIPMHYWDLSTKNAFISALLQEVNTSVINEAHAKYELFNNKTSGQIEIINLNPDKFNVNNH
jgi:L-ascorbate metabolism protein UlaG (beta-lactamase superfamily)